MPTPYDLAVQQINQKYAGTTTTSAPPPEPGPIKTALTGALGGAASLNDIGTGIKQAFTGGGYAQIPNPLDIVKSAAAPLTKGLATATRAVQATPQLAEAAFGKLTGNQQLAQQATVKGNQLMNSPIFGQQTAPGSTDVQNLGSAAQAASYLVPATSLGMAGGGAVAGGLQAGGQAATDPNATATGVATNTALGTGFGAAGGYALPKVGEKITSPIFQRQPTPLMNPSEVKVSPAMQDIQNNVTQSQNDLGQAQSQADFAAEQRKTATPQAVQGVRDINAKVTGNLKTLGEQFGNDAATLEKSSPTTKLNLTNEQVDALNALKENKNFTLPEKIQQAQDARASLPDSKYGNIKLSGKALEEFNAGQKATQVSLSPTEAQNLIKELNRSTFRQNADGSVTKDYQRLGITNEIKNAASQAFGDKWDAIYSKYSQGRGMIDKLDSIVNLDSKATPEELNKQLEGILKQSKTPEGKLLLQQAVDEYKQSSGVDLNDPIKSIQQIADKQTALDEANSSLTDAQKALNKAQRDADIAQLKQQQRMSTFKGRHPVLSQNANYFMKRAAWGLTGGAVIGALGLSGLLKKMFK